jgi:hypothetical protein
MSNTTERFAPILERLRATRFLDLAGGRFTGTIPVSEDLVNQVIGITLRPNAPVRSVSIRPEAADRFSVRIVPKMALIPAMTLQLTIEEQPRLPDVPVLTLRMVTLGGLFGLASGAIQGMLPPGVQLLGETIRIDLRHLAVQHGAAEGFDYLQDLQIHTEPGRLIVLLDAAVGPQ